MFFVKMFADDYRCVSIRVYEGKSIIDCARRASSRIFYQQVANHIRRLSNEDPTNITRYLSDIALGDIRNPGRVCTRLVSSMSTKHRKKLFDAIDECVQEASDLSNQQRIDTAGVERSTLECDFEVEVNSVIKEILLELKQILSDSLKMS